MRRITAFTLGVALAGAIALVCSMRRVPAGGDTAAEHWRRRAYEAEQQLATLQARLESLTAQLATLSRPTAVAPAIKQENTSLPLSPAMLPPPPAPLPPPRQEEWDALVGGMLQAEVTHRLGRTLSPGQERRLLDNLSRLRDASIGLSEEPLDPADPYSLRDQLMRTLTLLEVDRTFRDELGIGVSDFLQGLDGDQIEEVAPAGRVSKPLP